MELGTCKLCLQEKYLLKRSHIIQKALHKHLKSAGEQSFLIVNSRNLDKPDKVGDWMYEGSIFCRNCDNIRLGKIETNGIKVYRKLITFVTNKHNNNYNNDQNLYFEINGKDYSHLKLWVLLHLWRSSVASNDFFREVSLENKHQENLRLMLFNEDAKSDDTYPFDLYCYMVENLNYKQIILPPSLVDTNKNYVMYSISLCGFVFRVYLNDLPYILPNDVMKKTSDEEYILKIHRIRKDDFDSYIKKGLLGKL